MSQLPGAVALDASRPKPLSATSPAFPSGAYPAHRPGVITLALRTKAEVYLAWMPFVRGGGIFVPGAIRELGEEVFLLLTLPQDEAKIPLRGNVVWINPEHASGGRPQGIGISFEGDASAQELRQYVERMLANVLNSPRPTHTL